MPVDIPYAGASLGYAWAATRRLTVFPEIAAHRSPTEIGEGKRYTMFRFGIGFVIGGRGN